jgi:hypothetical protein
MLPLGVNELENVHAFGYFGLTPPVDFHRSNGSFASANEAKQ